MKIEDEWLGSGTSPSSEDINNMSDNPRYTVGDIVRLKANDMVRGFRVWKVNAVCLGGVGQESNYQLAPLDKTQGGDDTVAKRDCLVPCWLLETHPGIERV